MIGGDGSGDVCDCTLLVKEYLCYDNTIKKLFLSYHRYKDDIHTKIHSSTKPSKQTILTILHKIYGTDFKFKIKISNSSSTFLDVEQKYDYANNRFVTSPAIKPGNSCNYTKRKSNSPHSVLGSIICGLCKRFIIISDTYEIYTKRKEKLITDLLSCDWSEKSIRELDIKYWPSYQNRTKFINNYIKNFYEKRQKYVNTKQNEPINIFRQYNNEDENETEVIIFKNGTYNKRFHRLNYIRKELNSALEVLPINMPEINLILCNKSSPSLATYFFKT